MGGNQLPNKFNLWGTELAATVNELALHERHFRRFEMERKCIL